MIESISQNLNIPKLSGECIKGSEYGRIKTNFIKKYGTLSNYNIPWKQLNLKKIELNIIKKEFSNFNDYVYILMDLSATPIFKCSNDVLSELLSEGMIPYDIDIYIFDNNFDRCIIYTGLFDKNIYIIS